MTESAHVRYLIADTVAEETLTAPAVHVQVWDSGRGKVTLYREDGTVMESITYRRIERVRRVHG